MAAAIVPIITSVLPSVVNLIAGLVHKEAPAAEQQYGSGTGPVKFAAVFEQVIVGLQKAAAAGQIPKDLPSDETVKLIIQAVVTALQLTGNIYSAGWGGDKPQVITLSPGQSVTIMVAK